MEKNSICLVTFANNVNYGGALQQYALYALVKDHLNPNIKCLDFQHDFILSEMKPVRLDFIKKFLSLLSNRLIIKKNGSSGIRRGAKATVRAVQSSRIKSVQKTQTKKNAPQVQSKFISFLITVGTNRLYLMFRDAFNIHSRKRLVLNFKRFWRKHLLTTAPYTAGQLQNAMSETFDIYLSGSDQIWNAGWFDDDALNVYFLGFAPPKAKRIAFASSFGNFDFYNSPKLEQVFSYLKEYSHIGVREAKSSQILNEMGIKATHVLDPTLMLNKAQWFKCLGCKPRKGKYIFVYALYDHAKVMNMAQQVSGRLGHKIIVVGPAFFGVNLDANIKYLPSIGPDTFVKYLAGASFVVTNSFHATAFAVNFNVPFYSMRLHTPQRTESFLGLVGLTDRFLHYGMRLSEDSELNIDFTYANKALAQARDESMAFLTDALDC